MHEHGLRKKLNCIVDADIHPFVYYVALISLSFGGAIGLMFLMLGCALPVYE